MGLELNFLDKKTATYLVAALSLISCNDDKNTSNDEFARPNVIIIMTDDQGYGDLAYHGNPYLKTPNLDQFATESLELTNFHVGTTCTPTRAGIMTGRNANRNNAWHTIAGCSILLKDEETIAEVFARNGYRTAMFGKWHLGDNYPFRPHDRGFQHALYHGGGGVNQTPDFWNNNYFDDTYFRNGMPEKFKGYCTDIWFDEAIKYIDQTRDEAFFLYLAPNAAHAPFNVPEKYFAQYENAPITTDQKRFNGMISNIDDNVGKLLAHLKETGRYDNTILIFTTDNGTAKGIVDLNDGGTSGYNAGLRGTKGSHYDGGHRVPFFISWPQGNIPQKARINDLAAHVDLLPTLAEFAGLNYKPKKQLDGSSIANIIRGGANPMDRMLVVDTQRNQRPEKGRNSCVMSTQWRLVNGNELYNILDDPGQKTDVAAQHLGQVAKMQRFYEDWWTSILPDIRYAEIPLGDQKSNPVLITIHDMHSEDNLPWNQMQIRKGDLSPKGFYSIKVVEDGTYQFKLYRYPPQSGLFLKAAADEIRGSLVVDGLPVGQQIDAQSALVQIGDLTVKTDINDNAAFAVLTGELKKGNYELISKFKLANGTEFPSYYTEILKL